MTVDQRHLHSWFRDKLTDGPPHAGWNTYTSSA